MANRRQFFKTLAGATAGMYVMGRGSAANMLSAQAARRQIMVGGRRMRVVDIHQHWDMALPAELVRGTPFEEFSKGGAGLDERIPLLDKEGIDVGVVGVNDFWWYEATDRGLARAICNVHNETLGMWHRMHPDRLVGMASVPLQFPDLAAEMLQDAVERHGARGVTIGGHVNGENLTLPRFDPFWAKVAEMGELVFMHPNGSANIIKDDGLAGPGGLGNVVGNPLETTVFLSRLILDGTLDKFPALKVCGAHGGGFLPSYFGRTEIGTQRGNQKPIFKKPPREYLRSQILADTMVFSEEGLRHLVAEMGVSQVVFGTDIPFGWPVNVDLIANASVLSDAEKEAILGGNLIKLLRLA